MLMSTGWNDIRQDDWSVNSTLMSAWGDAPDELPVFAGLIFRGGGCVAGFHVGAFTMGGVECRLGYALTALWSARTDALILPGAGLDEPTTGPWNAADHWVSYPLLECFL